jgi:tetraacyldisaccharide 4'-kinase
LFKRQIQQLEARIEKTMNKNQINGFFSFDRCLYLCSLFYDLVVRCRLFLYEKKVLKTWKLPCAVISVGNVMAGGTGKTPMTVYIAQLLRKMGRHPVVISRGYKGRFKQDALVVSDGTTLFCSADVCGDEPFMMAQRKQFPVVVGKDRRAAGQLAINTFDCDVLVLDDGFQHVRLDRDINLLLMDWRCPLGNHRLIPAGRLREPVDKALPRADALVFTRARKNADQLESQGRTTCDLRAMGKPCFYTCHMPVLVKTIALNDTHEDRFTDLKSLDNRKALVFSGIANNHYVYQTLEKLGANIVSHLEFKDHYRYKKADVEMINHQARAQQAEVIVTTEKDWVKLEGISPWYATVVVIGIDVCFSQPDQFQAFLKARLF